MTVYSFDVSVFENTYLFKKRDLRSVLFRKMIVLFGIFKRSQFFRHGLFVLDKMSKTFHAKLKRFKKGGMNRSYSFGKGFGRRKKMKRKIMGCAIVFDVLQ
jgi:hypothetical protein